MSHHLFNPFKSHNQAKQNKKGRVVQEKSESNHCENTNEVPLDVMDQQARIAEELENLQEMKRQCEEARIARDRSLQQKRQMEERMQTELELLQCERSKVKLELQLKAVRDKLECLENQQNGGSKQEGSDDFGNENGEATADIVTDIEEKVEKMIISSSIYLEKHEPALYRLWCNMKSSDDARKLLQKIDRKLSVLNDLYIQATALGESYRSYEDNQQKGKNKEKRPLETKL